MIPKSVLDTITVVIPTLGRPIVKDCLHSILRGTSWPRKLIVVDQSSSSKVEILMKELDSFGLRSEYIPSTQTGRAAGINLGLEQVKSRFLCITDDDCIVDNNWLERMATRLQTSPNAIISGRVNPLGNEEVLSTITSPKLRVYDRPLLKYDPLFGGNMGLAMKLFNIIGKFDENPALRTAEDNDFGYRALRSGISIIYDPSVIVYHVGWRDAEQRRMQYLAYARSQGGFYGKHLQRVDAFIALRTLTTFLRAVMRWGHGVLSSNPEMAANGRAWTIQLFPGIVNSWRKE